MLRFGKWKYCHLRRCTAAALRPRCRSRRARRLAGDPRCAAALAEGERRLRAALDPEAVDARAKRRQGELLAQFGGREKALARGDLGFTPAPGTRAEID
jgi:choline-sulfatase